MDKDSIITQGRWLRVVYFTTLIASGVVFLGYAGYSLFYTPAKERVLLNQLGGLYVNEDLGKTNVTEGQVKQFAYEVLLKTFTYDYLSFSEEHEYAKLVSGETETSLPDHRDLIRPYYSVEAHAAVIDALKASPWMNKFHYQSRYLDASFVSPPIQDGSGGWGMESDGRLTISYKGSFFLLSNAYKLKAQRFRVDYTITLERKPLLLDAATEVYFFAPLVPPNAFEWRVNRLSWTVERRG